MYASLIPCFAECDRCGQWFGRQDNMMRHQLRVCQRPKQSPKVRRVGNHYTCCECPASFAHHSSSLRHYRQEHTAHQVFTCAHCGKTMPRKDQLRRHLGACKGTNRHVNGNWPLADPTVMRKLKGLCKATDTPQGKTTDRRLFMDQLRQVANQLWYVSISPMHILSSCIS